MSCDRKVDRRAERACAERSDPADRVTGVGDRLGHHSASLRSAEASRVRNRDGLEYLSAV
jgi:hypothetical protein